MNDITPEEIIAFWREAGPDKWWEKDADFDAAIRARFLPVWKAALAGKIDNWKSTANAALAFIIVLDQFSRNMFRGDARSFTGDSAALACTRDALARGFDGSVESDLRLFFYMPFVHSERLEDQNIGVELFRALPGAEENLTYAISHRDAIVRFGRFPHRNAVLGRNSTPAEQAYLDAGGGFA